MSPALSEPSSKVILAMQAPSEVGRRYEGNIEGKAGGHAVGGILFQRRSKDRLISARIYIKNGLKKKIKLVGAIYGEISAPGGLVFRFKDRDEVEYLFTLDGNNLKGENSIGFRYTFMYSR